MLTAYQNSTHNIDKYFHYFEQKYLALSLAPRLAGLVQAIKLDLFVFFLLLINSVQLIQSYGGDIYV